MAGAGAGWGGGWTGQRQIHKASSSLKAIFAKRSLPQNNSLSFFFFFGQYWSLNSGPLALLPFGSCPRPKQGTLECDSPIILSCGFCLFVGCAGDPTQGLALSGLYHISESPVLFKVF
jgi:hypothetical protein